jgi:hypothetical protein
MSVMNIQVMGELGMAVSSSSQEQLQHQQQPLEQPQEQSEPMPQQQQQQASAVALPQQPLEAAALPLISQQDTAEHQPPHDTSPASADETGFNAGSTTLVHTCLSQEQSSVDEFAAMVVDMQDVVAVQVLEQQRGQSNGPSAVKAAKYQSGRWQVAADGDHDDSDGSDGLDADTEEEEECQTRQRVSIALQLANKGVQQLLLGYALDTCMGMTNSGEHASNKHGRTDMPLSAAQLDYFGQPNVIFLANITGNDNN